MSLPNYYYIAVKGSLHATDCQVFGLNEDERDALSKRYSNSSAEVIMNGVIIKGAAMDVINSLSELGYHVVCSTGEAEIVWTMQREI
ncbi:hypothetical protein R5R35_002913 [Gryllus longicercus]|uniref:GTP cyclohydrolase 1 feedback regulatory protein n=2 Tax=Gryllus longicercus TaxID=2509291 RepID=A0AAN9ZCQ5_9ORTH